MKKKNKSELVTSIMMMVIGSGLLLGAWFQTEDTRRYVADSYVADATIVSVESKRDRKGVTYSPKVKFISKTGSAIESPSAWWSKHHYKEGEHIALRVSGNDPYHFSKNTFGDIWGFSLILWCLGVGSFLVGLFIGITTLIRFRNRQQNN